MKKWKMVKRIFCMFMAICMTMSVPMLSAKAAGNYTADWQRWSQGASGYAAMQYGCRVTAYSKMLAEAGYTGFGNPDGFFEWGKAKGYFRDSDTSELSIIGVAPVTYINENGGTASLAGRQTLTGNKTTDANTIMSLINQGYYVVLTCKAHSVYVGKAESISQGTPVILDSWASSQVGPSFRYESYTQYKFEMANYFRIAENFSDCSFNVNLANGDVLSGSSFPITGVVYNGGKYPWLHLYMDYEWVSDTANNENGNYAFYLDTTKYSNGKHLLGVKMTNDDGYDYTTWYDIVINNTGKDFTVNIEDHSILSGSLAPITGAVYNGGRYPWLHLYIDYEWVSDTANNENGNYAFYLDTTKYSNGEHLLGVKMTNDDGYDYTFWYNVNFQNSCATLGKEHIWNEGIVENQATCIEEGVKIFTCINCGETKKEKIVAKGHIRNYYTNNNGTHSVTCSNCGETEVSNCSYDKLVTEPTCKKSGYTTYTCRNCGYSYETDFVDCIKHSFTNYISDNNAQIGVDGTKTAYCDYGCGTTDTVVDEGSALETEQPGKEEPEKPNPEKPEKPFTTYTYKLNDDKTTITITKYTASDEKVAIPSSIDGYAVTGIDERAFQNITTMKTISFPSSLKSIGNYAFAGCTSLTMVTLPESLTELENYAFQGCVALQSAKLNAGLMNISEGLFQGCTSLSSVTMPDMIQYIRPNAFSGCTSLKTLSLPKLLSVVYANAFLNSGIKVIQYAGTNTDWQNVTIGITGNTSFLNATVTDSNGKTFSANKSKWNTSSPAPVKKPSVSKVRSFKAKAGKKKLTLTWNKISGAVGYQIQISTKKNFKGAKTISIFSSKKTYTKKSLKAKKKYYIRVRAYKTYKDANKKTQKVYGKWTTISKKTK